MERKIKLKRSFDTDYDDGEGARGSFYDDLKKEVDDQAGEFILAIPPTTNRGEGRIAVVKY